MQIKPDHQLEHTASMGMVGSTWSLRLKVVTLTQCIGVTGLMCTGCPRGA